MAGAACSPPAGSSTGAPPITVLHGFTLIDGTGRDPVQDAYVVIEDGLIADVGSGPAPRLDSATYRNLSGRYVVPGFVDARFHVDTPPLAELGKTVGACWW